VQLAKADLFMHVVPGPLLGAPSPSKQGWAKIEVTFGDVPLAGDSTVAESSMISEDFDIYRKFGTQRVERPDTRRVPFTI